METIIKGTVLNANGILGTGICLDQACKDDMAATNAVNNQLKAAQAQAIQNLSSAPASGGNNTTLIVVVIIVIVLVLGVGGWFLMKRKIV